MRHDLMKIASQRADEFLKECIRLSGNHHVRRQVRQSRRYLYDDSIAGGDPEKKAYIHAMYKAFWHLRDFVSSERSETSQKESSAISRRMDMTRRVADDVLQSLLGKRTTHSTYCRPSVGGEIKDATVSPMWLKRVHEVGIEVARWGQRDVLTLRATRRQAYALRPEGIELFEAQVFVPTRDGKNLSGYIFRVKTHDGGGNIVVFNETIQNGLAITRTAIRERVMQEL